jgi:hypothetical protein
VYSFDRSQPRKKRKRNDGKEDDDDHDTNGDGYSE